MPSWSSLGLPAPESPDYGFTLRSGIYRTPFPTFKPDQARQFAGKNRQFSATVELDRTQLATAEGLLRSVGYKQFDLPLLVDEGLIEVAVRLIEPYRVAPLGYRTFRMTLALETIAAFWTGQTYYVEDAELLTVYSTPEWSLPQAIPLNAVLEVRSGQVRYQPPGSSSWTQWVSTNLIVTGGGKIQLRQISSDERVAQTEGQVRISGVPWTIIIITADCIYSATPVFTGLYPSEFYESFSARASLLSCDFISAQVEAAEVTIELLSGTIEKTRELIYSSTEEGTEVSILLLSGNVYESRVIVPYADDENVTVSIAILSGSVTSLQMVYVADTPEQLSPSATLTGATLE